MNIVCTNLVQKYGSVEVPEGIDVDIATGVTALLGPNGAGTSTLFDILSTLRPPAAGTCTVGGVDVRSGNLRAIRSQLGFLPQTFGYPWHMTTLDFVRYHCWLRGHRKSATKALSAASLERVGLTRALNKRMGALSGGMLRRAGLAAATSGDPELVLLDEPTAGLDPAQRLDFRRVIGELGNTSTVLVSTHLTDDVDLISGRVIVLINGAIRLDGDPADLGATGHHSQYASAIEDGYLRIVERAATRVHL